MWSSGCVYAQFTPEAPRPQGSASLFPNPISKWQTEVVRQLFGDAGCARERRAGVKLDRGRS